MELADARKAYQVQREIKQKEGDPREVSREQKRKRELEREKQQKAEYSCSTMVDEYLREMVEKNRTAKSAKGARYTMERYLGSLGLKRLTDISTKTLHDHISNMALRVPDTARRFRAELKAAWNYSLITGRTDIACPINSQVGGKLSQGKRERYLTEMELADFLPWINNYSETVADALLLTLYLGLRSGEVCSLHDNELSSEKDGHWLTIPALKMKKRRVHRVPLSGTALRIILSRAGDGYLFPSASGGHINQKVLGVGVYAHSGKSSAKIYKSKAICPISGWAPNDLRKTARTLLASLRCPYEVAEAIIAHKIPGVGGLYNQYEYADEKRIWLTQLGEHLDGLNPSIDK